MAETEGLAQQPAPASFHVAMFACPICLEPCPRADVFVPSGCTHEFCKECARGVVLNALRNLDFPIDCPVCKLSSPDSEDEEDLPSSAFEPNMQSLLNRAHSDYISDQLGFDAVDSNHAMQLHASHSTPSLETATLPSEARNIAAEMAGTSRQGDHFGGKGFPAQFQQQEMAPNGLAADGDGLKSWLAPSVAIVATSAQHDSPHAVTNDHVTGQPMTRQHGSSPSFPQLVSEIPITPSLIVPAETFERQNSHSLFSPHDLTQGLPAEPAQSFPGELTQNVTNGLSPAGIGMKYTTVAPVTNGYRQTDGHSMDRKEQEELSLRSMSLGGVLTAPRGVTRGLSSPADWVAAVAMSRSSSTTSPPLSRGGSRGVPLGHHRRGSLDADVHKLLTHEEEEEYLSKSLKAAAHRYGSLVQCPKPDCEGVASVPEGDPHFVCPQCRYEWCRECQRDWHPSIRCQDVTGEKGISRYIPQKPKKKKGHRRGTSKGCLSMGSMGELLKGTMKVFGSMDLTEDSEASLNRFLKRNRVLECPQCKNGITKMDGGCNHVMCAVCKTHICWLCGVKICQGINNYWDANRHFWIKGTPCYGQIQAIVK